MELASHGYIVFLPDHHDGSCRYTENKDNTKQWWFDTTAKFEYSDMHPRVKQREQEIKELIDELHQKKFLLKTLNFNCSLKLDKLIMSGHSMGGATAIRVGASDNRVKCVLVNDPWLMPIREEIKTKSFTFRAEQSLYIANTSNFLTDFGIVNDNKLLIAQLKASSEIVQTNHCSHDHQADRVIPETLRIEWKNWF